ncbi:T9SS type A sorting domain-containing protein [Flavivirga eckloniae]|uniref:Secretion system C-terminal sorting domain-containing protein n=1 Tax=Flavivirga eckloniae TaxID=1803846 RepID=A0A2K9PLH7_9FLAO|nr:T9SS type A sorting domain-containing protein [Flavivirga eckloniae]AUP77876.1 hypothetical protein C1H87_03770 [Flavivirga eckloniae]
MKQKLYFLLLVLLCQCISFGQILDQSNFNPDSPDYEFAFGDKYHEAIGQSFVAGITGELSSIAIKLDDTNNSQSHNPPIGGTATLTIYQGHGYGGNVLGVTTFTTDGTENGEYNIPVFSQKIKQIKDSVYTFKLSGATGRVIANASPNAYFQGLLYTNSGENGSPSFDLKFKTFVTPPMEVNVSSQINVRCHGGKTGMATVVASGGTPPYMYIWSNGVTAASITDVEAGTYEVTVTDANNWEAKTSVTILEPTVLNLSIASQTNVKCNGGTTGSATASVTGGTSPYTYAWSNGATTSSITDVAAGIYEVTVTDDNGCTTTASTTITQPTALHANIGDQTNVKCNGGTTGSATASVTGGTSPYTYAWSNGATTSSITDVAAGIYEVTVTDDNGCTTTASTTITQPTALHANIGDQTNVKCNGGTTGSATASVTGGTSPYTYLWNNGATTASIVGVAAGIYEVTVTDDNGCTTTASTTITQPTALHANIGTQTNVKCYGGTTGSATISVTGGTLPYTYLWNNTATTASIVDVAAGVYEVTVTDNNECTTTTTTVTITEPMPLAPPNVITPVMYNQGDTASALTLDEEGVEVLWYTTESGGTGNIDAPVPNTETVGSTSYWVSSVSSDGCESEQRAEIVVTISGTLSTSKNDKGNDLALFPNPTSGTITIGNNQLLKEAQVTIYDLKGRALKKEALKNQPTVVDISDLSTGIYIFKIKTNDSEFVKRIVKQ